jgi:hypothetical protein
LFEMLENKGQFTQIMGKTERMNAEILQITGQY